MIDATLIAVETARSALECGGSTPPSTGLAAEALKKGTDVVPVLNGGREGDKPRRRRAAAVQGGLAAMCRTIILLCLVAAPALARTCHYSWWSDNPAPYLEAIHKAEPLALPKLAPGESIRAGIVTHHFLASALMVRFFAALRAQSNPETIILIGPNHFHHGLANISFSSLPWKTPFGFLEADQSIVRELETSTHLPEDPDAFAGEHSVGVLIPFVKYYFPRSRVVPILVDVNAREFQLREMRPLLARFLADPRIVILLSMDFSHDSVLSVADARDVRARQAMVALDANQVKDLNVDCPRGLWLLLGALSDLGHVRTEVCEHSNSARLTGNLNQENVTSYFTAAFIQSAATSAVDDGGTRPLSARLAPQTATRQ